MAVLLNCDVKHVIFKHLFSSDAVKVTTSPSSVLDFTFTAPAVLIHIISRRTDAGERTRCVHTSVLTQKLREAALIQVYRERKSRINTHRNRLKRVDWRLICVEFNVRISCRCTRSSSSSLISRFILILASINIQHNAGTDPEHFRDTLHVFQTGSCPDLNF